MNTAVHPLPQRRRRRLLIGVGVIAALLAGGLVNHTAPRAEAQPSECQPKIVGWSSGGIHTYTDKDGNEHNVEVGITPKFADMDSTCDVISHPTGDGGPLDSPDTSGGDAPPPAPPGPLLPKPPASKPAGAGPKCVAGANNAADPEASTDGATGDGKFMRENIATAEKSKDLVINMTSPSRIVSINVNLGAPESGEPGSNPFEGMTAEEAAQSLYWPGGEAPVTMTAGLGDGIRSIALLAIAGGRGDIKSRAAFLRNFAKLPPTTRNLVVKEILDVIGEAEKQYLTTYKSLPPSFQDLVDGVFELINLALTVPIDGPAPTDLAPLYAEASEQASTPGGPSGSACGQIASAEVTTKAGLTGGSDWVTITLTGTEHGTLVDELKTMAATPTSLYCPPVELDSIAGQALTKNVTDGCSGSVTGIRLLTRGEIDALSPEDVRTMMVPKSAEVAPRALVAAGTFRSYADSTSQSWLAEGNAGFGSGRLGDLYYKAPENAGGYSDSLVAAALDTDGVEHPFLITVGVKSKPTCTTDGPLHGLDPTGEHGYIHGGVLEVERATPFVLDLATLCSTDSRDSLRVDVTGAITGASSSVDADGNIAYDWTDTDTVGPAGTITLTAWDEVTGAPSTPVALPVVVRDRAPVCKDVAVPYDRAALKGAPLTITLDCSLPDGLDLVTTPVPRFPGGADGSRFEQPEGTLIATGSTIVFTPSSSASGTMTVTDVHAWSSTPGDSARPRESKPFSIRIEMKG